MKVVVCLLTTLWLLMQARPVAGGPWSAERLDSLMTARIAALEERWQIHFEPSLRPSLEVAAPGDSGRIQMRYLQGMYLSEFRQITLAPPESTEVWPKDGVLDHELMHAYCDQVSRRLGLGPWPDYRTVEDYTVAQAAALRMQNEGIATAATEGREHLPGSKWRAALPIRADECFVPGTIGPLYLYQGGRALVQQLIDHVSLDSTVVYVVSHPVDVRGPSFHRNLVRWVEQARRDLHIPDPYQKK